MSAWKSQPIAAHMVSPSEKIFSGFISIILIIDKMCINSWYITPSKGTFNSYHGEMVYNDEGDSLVQFHPSIQAFGCPDGVG